jgi:cation transporter-like permease
MLQAKTSSAFQGELFSDILYVPRIRKRIVYVVVIRALVYIVVIRPLYGLHTCHRG